jgi:hypothetical protein
VCSQAEGAVSESLNLSKARRTRMGNDVLNFER